MQMVAICPRPGRPNAGWLSLGSYYNCPLVFIWRVQSFAHLVFGHNQLRHQADGFAPATLIVARVPQPACTARTVHAGKSEKWGDALVLIGPEAVRRKQRALCCLLVSPTTFHARHLNPSSIRNAAPKTRRRRASGVGTSFVNIDRRPTLLPANGRSTMIGASMWGVS